MSAKAVIRGALSLALFGVFGAGAILIAPLMFLFRRPDWCQPIVRAVWCPLLGLFVLTRLIRVERGTLRKVRGAVIAMNHPSLIDVVVLSVLLPRTLYVAKHALLSDPCLAAVVRHTSLPDDANLPEVAASYLAKGWNVLVFPEGTRSPAAGGLQPLHRGAAQLALRTGAPLLCVGLSVSRRILGKAQPPWDMGEETVRYAFAADAPAPVVPREGESLHAAARRITREIRERICHLINQAKEKERRT